MWNWSHTVSFGWKRKKAISYQSLYLVSHLETIVAVEPLEKMRQQFSRQPAELDLRAASAEVIPIKNASVDAVICIELVTGPS